MAGPLTARFGKAILPPPGGDTIGRRRIDTHILALQELGARITLENMLTFSAAKLVGASVFLDEASVTGTENAIMAAVLAEGTTVLMNAACEPHVQDLCRMLIQMGAEIEGAGSNRLTIHGKKSLGELILPSARITWSLALLSGWRRLLVGTCESRACAQTIFRHLK